MEEILQFFKANEIWIYVLLALGGLLYVRKFILAWDEMRAAAFGLERESAQARLNQSVTMIVLFFLMGIAVFVLVTFVAPSYPGSSPLLTPTLDLLATTTNTLPAPVQTSQTGSPIAQTPTPTPLQGEGCTPGQVLISEPQDGTEVNGVVTIKGTASIPNFGFYKYEIARPGETVWLTIQAGRQVKVESELGQWDTRTLQSGDYMLRLVVTDNQGGSLPPCVIKVRVNNPLTP